MPKVWLPTCVTTMKPFSGSLDEPSSIFNSFFRCISGNSLLRSRKHGGVLDALDAVFGVGARPHQFDHGELRDRKTVAGGFHDQGRDDGERQRDLDGDG